MILAAGRARATPAVAGLAAVLLACASCADRTPPVVGIAMGADIGTPQALLAARQERFNATMGPRRKVTLRLGDDSLRAKDALTWANALAKEPGLIGVVGHESSRSALQAAPIYSERGVVEIVPTGTSSKLATVSPWTFVLVASDSSQGVLLARELIRRGKKRFSLLVQDDEYGRGIVLSIEKALATSDGQIVENVMHTARSDFALLVRSMLSHQPRPDALVLVTQGHIAVTVARLAWAQDPALLILGSDATITGSNELRALAPAPDKVALATYWLPDSSNAATRDFLKDFGNAHLDGEPRWNHAALYDAVGLLNEAAAEVGGNPRAVRDYLLSLGRNRPAYQGVLGPIDFTGKQRIPARLIRPSATGWELVK